MTFQIAVIIALVLVSAFSFIRDKWLEMLIKKQQTRIDEIIKFINNIDIGPPPF